ncbi:MAG: hypothetical protein KTR24_04795 [Saprospiraceae bacterium]|nr:hypothetical protein [Saprospiraceae bacterium]
MKRRQFLHVTGTIPVVGLYPQILMSANKSLKSFADSLRVENEQYIGRAINQQHMIAGERGYGSIPNVYGIDTPGGAGGFLAQGACGYLLTDSKWHHGDLLLERMQLAAEYLLRVQHDDGTIDLYSTNFHSTPDVAFVVEPVALSLKLLRADASTSELRKRMTTWLLAAGDALSVGGIHTPNHRWVVSMALARINELFPNPKYLSRIDQWLSEGIDIDPDGQYTERSSSVYSPLTDRCLLTIALLTEHRDLAKPVRRNLEMSKYYLHLNGEVVTEASTRQDQYRIAWPAAYHYPYLKLGLMLQDKGLLGMAEEIRDLLTPRQLLRDLPYFLEDPSLLEQIPDGVSPPTRYFRFFSHSEVVRFRHDAFDVSVMGSNPTLLTVMKKAIVLQAMRFSAAFFGKGQFISDEMLVEGNTISLRQTLSAPYYQPFEEDQIDGTGVWENMDRKKRDQSEVQYYQAEVRVTLEAHAIQISIQAGGTDHVPVSLELNFRSGGEVLNATKKEGASDDWMIAQRQSRYQLDQTVIDIVTDPTSSHTWTTLRGARPRLEGTNLYLTGFTPFETALEIR